MLVQLRGSKEILIHPPALVLPSCPARVYGDAAATSNPRWLPSFDPFQLPRRHSSLWVKVVLVPGPAVEAARLLNTARQMVDTPRWWLMRWPRNTTALLVRAGSLKDDEASKLFRALRVTAVRFGLELAALPKARRDAKEATDARAALRKRWVATVEKLGPGYRTSEAPRCQTGLQLLTCPRTRFGGLSTAGPPRCQGR